MLTNVLLPILFLLGCTVYFTAAGLARRARTASGARLHSLPGYHGIYAVLWASFPTLLLLALLLAAEPHVLAHLLQRSLTETMPQAEAAQIMRIIDQQGALKSGGSVTAAGESLQLAREHSLTLSQNYRGLAAVMLAVCFMLGAGFACRRIHPALPARNIVERTASFLLFCCAAIALLCTVGIVFSILFEALRFFQVVGVGEFLFGLTWSPQTAIRPDQAGSSGAFGAVPVLLGTTVIAAIAMFIAVPIGLMAAIYLSEYAGSRLRAVAKPLLEILAGIPTVVYGFFAALTAAPLIRDIGVALGLNVASESALAAGVVMGIMIIPFVSSLSDDVIHAVPQTLRDGSYALGATKYETIRSVVIPAALPGIVGGIMLAVSRAIGETMIVVMAAGLAANLTVNPLQAVTTVTVQIVTLLVGDQEFDSPKTLAAFALGLVLFVATLILNVIALHVVRKYREHYE